MTIEEKTKAYDEAIERARIYSATTNSVADAELIELIFPELAESEDERIRKELIKSFNEYLKQSKEAWSKDVKFKYVNVKDAIAWLEKQGEQNKNHKTMIVKFICKKDWHGIGDYYYGKIYNGYPCEKEQKGYDIYDDNHVPTFCDEDFIDEYFNIVTVEKQGKQKPIDKIEPKFHESEWITNGDYTWKIVEVKPLDYILQSQDGNIVDDTISHVDEQFHSFTIEDAKPGDVIYLPNGNNEYYFFIFKGIENAAVMSFAHFYQYNDGTSKVEGTIDKLTSINDIFQPATKEQRDLLFSKMKEAGYTFDFETKELKKAEQNPAKIEFNVGDWIVFNGLTLLVNEVVRGYYRTVSIGGIYNSYDWDIDNVARLWTIQDAKDGDVLAYNDSKNNVWICIFKEYANERVYDYCTLDKESFWEYGNWNYLASFSYIPATKEQRDLLFSKMQEAGYIFDFEKKELKKFENEIEIPFSAKDSELQEATYYIPKGFHAEIEGNNVVIKKGEQKYAWSKEDERMYRGLHNLIYSTPYCDSRKELSDWLKALKDIVQSKQEWGKEDEKCIRLTTDIIDSALRAGMCVQLDRDRCVDWLKSLRPQNTWKPSDEQMIALEHFVRSIGESGYASPYDNNTKLLYSLLEQLKRFGEE